MNRQCGGIWKCEDRGYWSGKGDESVLTTGKEAKIITLWPNSGITSRSKRPMTFLRPHGNNEQRGDLDLRALDFLWHWSLTPLHFCRIKR